MIRPDRVTQVWTLLLVMAFAFLKLHPVADPDTFWHLALGRAVVAQHARTFPEPFAFAAFSNPCTAPEWLWDLLAFGVFRFTKYSGLSVLLSLLSATAALVMARLVWRFQERRWSPAQVAVTACLLAVTMSRAILRPQVSYLIALPGFLLLTMRYFESVGRRRVTAGLALVVVELVWAQLHGSFVLGPAVFSIYLCAHWSRDRRRADLLCLLGLVGAMLTNAYGFSFLSYLISHSSGDAVRHIDDMRAPTWSSLTPLGSYNAAYLVLVLLALAGALTSKERRRLPIALAGCGLALFWTATRFIDVSAILLLPLSLRGATALSHRFQGRTAFSAAAIVLTGGLVTWFGVQARGWWGPAGLPTLSEARLPIAAAAAIRTLPAAQNVLSSYEATGPLELWLDGHSRVFVDGRTPLYFDDADYALARDLWFRPKPLLAGLLRYGVTAVVAPRDSLLCKLLSEVWTPLVVESGFTTFVRRGAGAAPTTRLVACGGDDYWAKEVCEDGGVAAAEQLEQMAAFAPLTFFRILRADLLARCGKPGAESALPPRSEAWDLGPMWNRTRARQLLFEGHPGEAFSVVQDQIAGGDLQALDLVFPRVLEALSPSVVRQPIQKAVLAMDDDAPASLRADLARLCMAEGDEECARFQGVRAAAAGNAHAAEPLEWLSEHASSARVRADAGAWLAVLRRSLSSKP